MFTMPVIVRVYILYIIEPDPPDEQTTLYALQMMKQYFIYCGWKINSRALILVQKGECHGDEARNTLTMVRPKLIMP